MVMKCVLVSRVCVTWPVARPGTQMAERRTATRERRSNAVRRIHRAAGGGWSVDPRSVDRYTRGVGDALPGDVSPTDERTRRILDAAVQLAEGGGFAAVRLRDVAQTSGVALGTVYKRFRSKEELLVGVLSREIAGLRARLGDTPIAEAQLLARVVQFFAVLTDFLCDRPNFARAVVRSAASGEPGMSQRLHEFHSALFELGAMAVRGTSAQPLTDSEVLMLGSSQYVWFAALCGWASGLYPKHGVVQRVTSAARLMHHGVDKLPASAVAEAFEAYGAR
jgi:AcrR family transcriptional regulator